MDDRPDFIDLQWWQHPHPPNRKRAQLREGELVEVWLHPRVWDGMTLCVYQQGRWRKVGWAPDFTGLEVIYDLGIDDPAFKQDLTPYFPPKVHDDGRLF